MVLGKGRTSGAVSHADDRAAIDVNEKKKPSALATLRKVNKTLKQHTAVTSTEEDPGVSSSDRKAGTAIPVAQQANDTAVDAGSEAKQSKIKEKVEIKKEVAAEKGEDPNAAVDEVTDSEDEDDDNSVKAEVEKRRIFRHRMRIASTETHFREDDSQQKRAERVRHFLELVQEKGIVEAQQEETEEDKEDSEEKNRHRYLMIPGLNLQDDQRSVSSKKSKSKFNILHPRKSLDARRSHKSQKSVSTLPDVKSELPQPQSSQRPLQIGAPYSEPENNKQGTPHPNLLSPSESLSQFVDAPEAPTLRTASPPTKEAYSSLTPRNRFVGKDESPSPIPSPAPIPKHPDGSRKLDIDNVSLRDMVQEYSPDNKATGSAGSAEDDANADTYSRHLKPEEWQQIVREKQERTEKRIAMGKVDNPDDVFSSGDEGDNDDNAEDAKEDIKNDKAKEKELQLKKAKEREAKKAAKQEEKRLAKEQAIKDGFDVDDEDSDEDSEEELENNEFNIPAGSVPGLGIGDEDPRLPHERLSKKERKKVREEQLMTEEQRLEKAAKKERTQQARQRFLDQQEKVRAKQEMQAESAGWRQVGGWESGLKNHDKEENEDLLSKMTVLDTYVSDKYLGDWYHNAGLIVITALFAWIMGRVGLSMSWLSIVLFFTATAYRTSVRRMRRNARDDILRQVLLENSSEKDSETMEWLNSFLIKFWLIFEPSLSQMITEIGNEVLQENTPTFIHSIKIDKFTLGTKSPRIDFVTSFPRTNAQIVVIDMGCSFTPNDTMDLTKRQLETKVNPKVQLGVRVGKGPFVKNLPILLEDMMFKGKFRLRIRLMERPPHIQTVDFSFLAPPEFDFVLKPIGGDTFGFDINIIPGLSKFIKETVDANLGPMFYAPNAFQVNIEQLLAGVGVMSGVGVLTIQIIDASELSKSKTDNRVDPYVVVRDKSQRELAHTKIMKNTTNPKWNETINVIITNAADNVLLEVFDFDDSQPDRSIGTVPIEVNQLVGSEISRSEITSGGKRAGYLKFIAKYSPVIMPTSEDEENGRGVRDMKSGILNIKIQGARELDPSVVNTALLSPSADIEFSGRLIDSTKVSANTNNPEWNFSAEHIVMDKVSTLLTIRLKDHRSKGHISPQIGIFKMRVNQLLIENEKGHTWFQLKDNNDKGAGTLGEVRVETQWKPANISVGGSTNNYVQPLGVVRLTIKNAKNLRNLEHIGKIDPYTRVFVGKRLVGRTDWFKNELNPVWNESMYFPIQSELQDLTIEVMDVENHAKDRSLGAFKVKLSSILKRDEHDNLKVFVSEKSFESKLMLPNRGPKGTVEYSLEFYPAIPVVSPSERERIQTDERVIDIFKKKIAEHDGKIEKALTPAERNDLVSRQERLDFSGVDMPVDELLTYPAGVFAVAVVSLKGQRLGQRLRIIANNSPFPIFTSPKFKSSKRYTSDDCPDFVSGQIQLSSLRFELGTFGSKSSLSGVDDDNDDVADEEYNAHDINAAEITIPCKELIKDASYTPKAFEMQNGAVIELQARFFPLPGLIIDPSEDISHCGNIEINLIRADDVPPADPSGLSDPYCAFYLNNHGDKVYKSKIHKETLNPVWNEFFRFAVEDYRDSFVKAIVKDWDMGNSDDFLGGYKFEMGELEPLVWKDYAVELVKMKATREIKDQKPTSGTLYMRMRFLPGHLHKDGDHFVVGAASVAKMAGGLAHLAGGGVIGVVGAAGFSITTALGVVGAAAQGPTALKEKIHDIGNRVHKETTKVDKLSKSYSVNIDSLTGFEGIKHDVQIRCSLLGDKEREVYRSKSIKIENGEATLDISFSFKALPDVELGIKIIEMKSLGRHSDVAQSSTDLNPGPKEVQMTKTAIASISISED